MAKQIKLYRLFIASPSDIENERNIISEVVTDWNIQQGQTKSVNIEVASWHTHSYPSHGDRPQGLINKQVFDSSDIIVGVFWTHFGTPTGVADSGTEEEIIRGISQEKKVMVYFSDKPIPPSKLKIEEYQKIQEFKDEYRNRGIYFPFKEEEEFRKLFRQHLAAIMDELIINNDEPNEPEDPKNPTIPISLSAQYWTIILASLDPIVESSFEKLKELREKNSQLEDIPKPMVTALVGPMITRGIIIDELAKHNIVNEKGKEALGIDSITKKMRNSSK